MSKLLTGPGALLGFILAMGTAGCNAQTVQKAPTAAAPGVSPTLAVVDGKPVTEADLDGESKSQLQALKTREYEIKLRAVESAINDRLLEKEAKAKKITPEDLLKQEVDSKVKPPTDADVAAFYEAQKARINVPLPQVKEQIREALRQREAGPVREAYFASLRSKHGAQILLDAPRTEVAVDPKRVRGPVSAPITIVEFSDYQCPFCQRTQSTLQAVLSKYGPKVRHAYRDFPLEQIHGQANRAAQAARCAADQNKFWDYHTTLFANPSKLDDKDLLGYAENLKLNSADFQACLTSSRYAEAVDKDQREGAAAGVEGTPAFFINGILLSGAQPLSAFEKVIDRELDRAGKK